VIEQLWNDNILWRILGLPLGWRLWVFWLMLVNTACVFFLTHRTSRIVGLTWIGNVFTMMIMYWSFGFVRLLGLSHVIWWTPLLVWLVPRVLKERPGGRYGVWLRLLIVSDLTSLVIDYIDVARYLLGER